MTKFAEPKFSVAAPMTPEYEEGYARTFPAALDEKACTECRGSGRVPSAYESNGAEEGCGFCDGTGLRAWQMKG